MYDSKGEKMNKKIIAALLAVVMLFSFTACGEKGQDAAEAAKQFKTAAEHINHAYFEGIDLKSGIGMQIELGVKGGIKEYLEKQMTSEDQKKYIPFIDAFLKETQLSYLVAYKMADEDKVPVFNVNYGLKNNGKNLVDLELKTDSDSMAFSFPALSDKGFFLTYAKLAENVGEEDMKKIGSIFNLDFNKYLDILKGDKTALEFYSTELAKYKEISDKYINENATKTETTSIERDGKNISVTEYKIPMDFDMNVTIAKELLNTAKEDEALLDLIIAKSTAMLDEFISSKDYEMFDMTEEEIMDYKARFDKYIGEDKANLVEAWKDAIDKILATYESEEFKESQKQLKDVTIESLVRIDAENKFDSVSVNFSYKPEGVSEAVQIYTDAIYNHNPEFGKVDKEKFFSLDGMVSTDEQKVREYVQENPEFAEYVKSFLKDVATYVSEGENVKHINELMKANGLEQEEAMFNMMTQQVKSMLDNMTVDQIMGMFAQ